VAGTLHVVATPLGNLDDLSPRARDVLDRVSCIACEDTRRTAKLLARFGLDTPTISCHRFNEAARLESVLERLRRGDDVALVSDGGTPAVSDPGARLVDAALTEGIRVSPVPGPSAVIALLSACGFDADRFVFDGFLPHRAGERRRRLRELATQPRTVVAFEAPHRILKTLDDLAEVLGDRPIVLGREVTKIHETILRGCATELKASLETGPVRGEITLVIRGAGRDGGSPAVGSSDARLLEVWREELERAGGKRRDALRTASSRLGMKRSELFRRLAELGADRPD
jgi:16S rRNA (cytidine1402-2'-O)-methyltransferase